MDDDPRQAAAGVPHAERDDPRRQRHRARPGWRRSSSTSSSRATRCSSASTACSGTRMVDVASAAARPSRRSRSRGGRSSSRTRSSTPIERIRPKVVAIVHAETSTGAHQPVDRLGAAVHEHGGAVPARLRDEPGRGAGGDRRVGRRRGLQRDAEVPLLPAGPVAGDAFAARGRAAGASARTRCRAGTSTCRWSGNTGARSASITTPPRSTCSTRLHEALAIVLEEGLENRFARHRQTHEMLRSGAARAGHHVRQPGRAITCRCSTR